MFKLPWTKTEDQASPAVSEPAEAPVGVAVELSAPEITAPEILWSETDEFRAAAAQIAQEAATQALAEVSRALVKSPIPQMSTSQQAAAYPLYAYDQPITFQTPQSPKQHPGSQVSVDTLRQVADTYDILRSCIQHLKREVAAVPVEIVAKDTKDDSPKTKRQIRDATAFMTAFGGLGGYGQRRQHFERMILEDLLTVGAAAMYHEWTLGGDLMQVIPIDAATIRPWVDGYGWGAVGEDEKAYEQWVMGVIVAEFTHKQLRYDGLHPTSYSPYFKSPVEYILQPVNSALRADAWNLAWLTDGNTPSDILALPPEWSPDQIKAWFAMWEAQLAGNSRSRQKTKFVPGGSQRVGNPSRKDSDFQEFELWLMRRTCSVMGVSPASIGFSGEQYKVSQEGSISQTSLFGAGELLDFRKETYDDLWARMGFDRIETRNVLQREEDANTRADRNVKYVGGGIKTINEARSDEGLEPIEGGDVLLVSATLVPLDVTVNPQVNSQAEDGAVDDPAEASDPGEKKSAQDTQRTLTALKQWERKALNRLRAGRGADCAFESVDIPHGIIRTVRESLTGQVSREALTDVFDNARIAIGRTAITRKTVPADLSDEILAVAADAPQATFDALYAKLRAEIGKQIAQPLRAFAAGDLEKEVAAERANTAQSEAHANAAHLGRKKGGDPSAFGDYERTMGERVAEEQAPYLDKFIADIESGKYTGEDGSLDTDAIEARAQLYERRLRGTANEAWANSVDEEIIWNLGSTDNHCGTCEDIANRSPYKSHQLPTYPGDGATECSIGCDCSLSTASGLRGF